MKWKHDGHTWLNRIIVAVGLLFHHFWNIVGAQTQKVPLHISLSFFLFQNPQKASPTKYSTKNYNPSKAKKNSIKEKLLLLNHVGKRLLYPTQKESVGCEICERFLNNYPMRNLDRPMDKIRFWVGVDAWMVTGGSPVWGPGGADQRPRARANLGNWRVIGSRGLIKWRPVWHVARLVFVSLWNYLLCFDYFPSPFDSLCARARATEGTLHEENVRRKSGRDVLGGESVPTPNYIPPRGQNICFNFIRKKKKKIKTVNIKEFTRH